MYIGTYIYIAIYECNIFTEIKSGDESAIEGELKKEN